MSKSRTGRPPFKPTRTQRRRVSIVAAAGVPHASIAIALGVSRNTLSKHFDFELNAGAVLRRMEIVEAMFRAGLKGSASAQKAFLAMTPIEPLPQPDKPLGKKAAAQAAAPSAHIDTAWEQLLSPKVIQ